MRTPARLVPKISWIDLQFLHMWINGIMESLCRKVNSFYNVKYSYIQLRNARICIYNVYKSFCTNCCGIWRDLCLRESCPFFLSCLARAPCCCFISHHLLSLGASLGGTLSITHAFVHTHQRTSNHLARSLGADQPRLCAREQFWVWASP